MIKKKSQYDDILKRNKDKFHKLKNRYKQMGQLLNTMFKKLKEIDPKEHKQMKQAWKAILAEGYEKEEENEVFEKLPDPQDQVGGYEFFMDDEGEPEEMKENEKVIDKQEAQDYLFNNEPGSTVAGLIDDMSTPLFDERGNEKQELDKDVNIKKRAVDENSMIRHLLVACQWNFGDEKNK